MNVPVNRSASDARHQPAATEVRPQTPARAPAPTSGPLAQLQHQVDGSPRSRRFATLQAAADRHARLSAPSPQRPVVQAKWLMKGLEPQEQAEVQQLAGTNPLRGFLLWLQYQAQWNETELAYLKTYVKAYDAADVAEFLAGSLASEDKFNSRYLFSKVQELMGRRIVVESSLQDTSGNDDHPEGVDAKEELIDWSELSEQGFKRIPDTVLFELFINLAQHHYQKAGLSQPQVDLREAYARWREGGVFTRGRFKNNIGLKPQLGDDGTNRIVQLARVGNTYSQQDSYAAKGGFGYRNAVYYRDGVGNIDFTADPATILANYNAAHGAALQATDVAWQDPVDAASRTNMARDLTDTNKGVMPSGKAVHLAKASRSQHFAIADMLYPNARAGRWTWHHLSPRYEMVLVDMTVHAKHGHNGGVYIW